MMNNCAAKRARCPSHPGALALDIIETTGRTKTEIAKLLLISRGHLYAVLNGKTPVTPDMAARFGKLFGNGSSLWLRMQAAYDEWQTEHNCPVDLSAIPTLPRCAPKESCP